MARPRAFDHDQAVAAAAELFRQRGYESTSMRDLIAQLGMSSSSIYAAFGDKDGLFMAALTHAAAEDTKRFGRTMGSAPDFLGGMRRLYDDLIDDVLADDTPWITLTFRVAVELANPKPAVRSFMQGYVAGLIDPLATGLRAAAERGELRLSRPPDDLALYLLLCAFNLPFVAMLGRERQRLEAFVAVALSVIPEVQPAAAADRAAEGS